MNFGVFVPTAHMYLRGTQDTLDQLVQGTEAGPGELLPREIPPAKGWDCSSHHSGKGGPGAHITAEQQRQVRILLKVSWMDFVPLQHPSLSPPNQSAPIKCE